MQIYTSCISFHFTAAGRGYYLPSFNDGINFGDAFGLSLFLRLIESMMGFRLRQENLRLVSDYLVL